MPACLMRKSSSVQSPEASGIKLIWFCKKGMVIWQQSTYPISSTVVAKGLCQLSETGNKATADFTRTFWDGFRVSLDQRATEGQEPHSAPLWRVHVGRSVSHRWGTSCPRQAQGLTLTSPWWLSHCQEIVLAGTAQTLQAPHEVIKHGKMTWYIINSK